MAPIWMRTTNRTAEIAAIVCFLLLGALVLYDAIRLGPGWGESGPQPGFFPFSLAILMVLGAFGTVYVHVVRHPDERPFFEIPQEVTDLLKVGVPIALVVLAIPWLGLYATAGLYLAAFMGWYGKFRWYTALAGGIVLSAALWITLREGFNISMPMSMFYKSGGLPF